MNFCEINKLTVNVLMHNEFGWALGSIAATKSQTLIFPSYAPLTILFESKRMQRTSSSCPSSTRKHAPHSMSQRRIELSELPLTTKRSRYCRHAMPRLCPFKVLMNSHDDVLQTLIVLSPDAETMYFSSKSTTLTAARCPTSTRRNVISFGDVMSQTAIERSCKRKSLNTNLRQEAPLDSPLNMSPSSHCWSANAGQPRSDESMCLSFRPTLHPRHELLSRSTH